MFCITEKNLNNQKLILTMKLSGRMPILFMCVLSLVMIALLSPVEVRAQQGDWWNTSWAKCRDIYINVTDNSLRINEYVFDFNATGLTFQNATKEIMIVDAPCNEGGSEVPVNVRANSTGSTPAGE